MTSQRHESEGVSTWLERQGSVGECREVIAAVIGERWEGWREEMRRTDKAVDLKM